MGLKKTTSDSQSEQCHKKLDANQEIASLLVLTVFRKLSDIHGWWRQCGYCASLSFSSKPWYWCISASCTFVILEDANEYEYLKIVSFSSVQDIIVMHNGNASMKTFPGRWLPLMPQGYRSFAATIWIYAYFFCIISPSKLSYQYNWPMPTWRFTWTLLAS